MEKGNKKKQLSMPQFRVTKPVTEKTGAYQIACISHINGWPTGIDEGIPSWVSRR